MNKYHITGRLRTDVPIDEIIEASTEDAAINKAEKNMMKKININVYDILDTEYYAEKVN